MQGRIEGDIMGRLLKIKINGKILTPGYISDDGTRLTMPKKDKHIYRNFNSFGISEQVLDYLIKIGIKETLIIWHKKDDTEEVFKIPIQAWKLGQKTQEGKFEPQVHISIPELRKISNASVGKVEIL